MHMADALISPAVGGSLWAGAVVLLGACCRHLRRTMDDRRIPLMGVLGAFVFAAQMVNFAIPGTGSSGHLGGGLLLTLLVGPAAAFVTIASVLTVQALFFLDGGLLALGCNIINLGLFPCFVAYPLVFRPLAGPRPAGGRLWWATVVTAIVGLELGALGVVAETCLSGLSDLPLAAFLGLMLPIHLPIGIVEGAVTAGVVTFVRRARPDLPDLPVAEAMPPSATMGPLVLSLAMAAVLTGGALSWFASAHPDGLEWALGRVTGGEEVASRDEGAHRALAELQNSTAILPDYAFPKRADGTVAESSAEPAWPAVDAGTTVAGVVGGALTVVLVLLLALALRRRSTAAQPPLG